MTCMARRDSRRTRAVAVAVAEVAAASAEAAASELSIWATVDLEGVASNSTSALVDLQEVVILRIYLQADLEEVAFVQTLEVPDSTLEEEEEEEEEDVVVASKGARAVRRKRSAQPEDVTLWRAAHNHQVEASTPSAGECAGFFARPHLLLACGRQLASVAAVETSFDQLGSAALCWRAADTAVVINSLVGPWFLIITVILYLCTNKLTDRQPELRLCPCTT